MIELKDVWYHYRREEETIAALEGVNLEVQEGEFLAVIGHNGSGKSTLAKHLNALLLPGKGDVYVGGLNTKEPEHLWDIRQQVGMVFQNPDNQLVATVVEEDVAFGPENLSVPPALIRKRVDEALASVGLEEFRLRAPHLLSGGQKQRVAIAGVLAMRPRVLVLDEPTAMLDPQGSTEVLRTVRSLNREEGMTVVYITHFMEEAVAADRVIVMETGRVAMEGTPVEIFSRARQLEQLGLDVPQVVNLAAALRQEGIDVPRQVLTVEQMLDWLISLKVW